MFFRVQVFPRVDTQHIFCFRSFSRVDTFHIFQSVSFSGVDTLPGIPVFSIGSSFRVFRLRTNFGSSVKTGFFTDRDSRISSIADGAIGGMIIGGFGCSLIGACAAGPIGGLTGGLIGLGAGTVIGGIIGGVTYEGDNWA